VRGRAALPLVVAAALWSAGSAVGANNVTVTLASAPTPAGSSQRCISIAVADSVTGQPLAADVQLQIGTPGPVVNGNQIGGRAESVQAKTDFSGKGILCVDAPGGVAGAVTYPVTLAAPTSILIHSSPDYVTGGTANSFTLSFRPAPSISLSPTETSTSVLSGQSGTVDVTMANTGNATAQLASLEVDLSGAAAHVRSVTTSAGSCSSQPPVTCSFGDLAAGAQASIELVLDTSAVGDVSMSFIGKWRETGAQSSTTGGLDLTVTSPAADLRIALRAPKGTLRMGIPATITALVTDGGPQDAAGSSVTFILPAGLKLLRFLGAGVTCTPSTRRCTIATLRASAPLRIQLQVTASKAALKPIVAKVAVAGATDPVASNNSARLTLKVSPAAKG
jgi:hypothetical protein